MIEIYRILEDAQRELRTTYPDDYIVHAKDFAKEATQISKKDHILVCKGQIIDHYTIDNVFK